jgi:hypothetical protein
MARDLRPFLLGARPPADPADRPERLRFLRDFLARSLLISVPAAIVAVLVIGELWAALVLGAVLLLTVLDVVYLTFAMRR